MRKIQRKTWTQIKYAQLQFASKGIKTGLIIFERYRYYLEVFDDVDKDGTNEIAR